MEKLLKLLGLLVLTIPLAVLKAFVVTKVWALTVVPMLHAPEITKWQAFAITYLVSTMMINGHNYSETKETGEALGKMIGKAVALLLTWGVATLIFG